MAVKKPRHGLRYTSEYVAWQNMRRRCLDPKNEKYASYGGRGIKVCDRWINSPATFVADMGLKPSPKHSLDRINNDGNYEPGNCRWATSVEQFNNRSERVSVFKPGKLYTLAGQTQHLSAWARQYRIGKATVRDRLSRSGWGLHQALATPSLRPRALKIGD